MSSFAHLVNSILHHCLNVWPTLAKVTNCCLNLLNTSKQRRLHCHVVFWYCSGSSQICSKFCNEQSYKEPSLTNGRTYRECGGMRSYCCYRDKLVWLSCRHNCSLLTQPSRAIKLWMASYSYSLWSLVVTTKSCVIT